MSSTFITIINGQQKQLQFLLLLFIVSGSAVMAVIFCNRPANETDIRRRLFGDTGKNGRLLASSNANANAYAYGTRIKLMVSPLGLWELSEQTDIASLLFYVKIIWTDPSKKWNDFSSRECLMLSFDTPVWKPIVKFVDDRSMLISARVIYEPEVMHLLADGTFFYTNIFQVRQIVRFDTAQFPFDQVRMEVMCNVDNVYSNDLDYIPSSGSRGNRTLELTPDWELVKNLCEKDNTNATQCEIVLSRNAQFYIVNFCVPTLATTTLAVFGIHSAVQVNSRSSKYQMGLMALISLSTVSFSFVGSLPRSGHVSRLHVFYFGMVGAIFSSCLISWAILSIEKSNRWSRWRQHRTRHHSDDRSGRALSPTTSDSYRRRRRRPSESVYTAAAKKRLLNNNNINNTDNLGAAAISGQHIGNHSATSNGYAASARNPADGSGSRGGIRQDYFKEISNHRNRSNNNNNKGPFGWIRRLHWWCNTARAAPPPRNFLRTVDAVSVILHVFMLISLTLWFMSVPKGTSV